MLQFWKTTVSKIVKAFLIYSRPSSVLLGSPWFFSIQVALSTFPYQNPIIKYFRKFWNFTFALYSSTNPWYRRKCWGFILCSYCSFYYFRINESKGILLCIVPVVSGHFPGFFCKFTLDVRIWSGYGWNLARSTVSRHFSRPVRGHHWHFSSVRYFPRWGGHRHFPHGYFREILLSWGGTIHR